MSIQDIDPQFRLDADVAPTFIVKNYNVETGEFSVFYNDGTLNDDECYGPIAMDLYSLKPETEEPLMFQIAEQVYNAVTRSRLAECDMTSTQLVLSGMLGIEQSVPMEDLMKHRETMAKKNVVHTDPILSATTITSIYSEDDFDADFEAMSAAMNSES